jgi:hypothetical protein
VRHYLCEQKIFQLLRGLCSFVKRIDVVAVKMPSGIYVGL